MTDLGSAPLPALAEDDHVRGAEGGRLVIEYGDFECHFCAMTHVRLLDLPIRHVFPHFPVRSKHPRARACACAAEAAARQGGFWELHDALYADHGRLVDPHRRQRAREPCRPLAPVEAASRTET